MQAYFKLGNDILDYGLTPNELKVAVCLYSCVFGGHHTVKIKQKNNSRKMRYKEARNLKILYVLCKERALYKALVAVRGLMAGLEHIFID